MSTIKNYFYISLLVMAILLPSLSQGAYLVNAGFGENGISLTGFDNYDDRGHAMALQEDGKIIVVGVSDNGSDTDFAVARYNSDGSLDTTFNSDGKATFKIGSGDDGAYGVTVLHDGTIVVVGFTVEEEKKNIALVRLTPAGYLDLDFGVAGQVVLKVDDSSGEARDVIIDEENRLLVGGTLQADEKKWVFAARFLSDGTIDASFGDEGVRRIEKGVEASGNVIAQQSNGKIVLGGTAENGTTENGTTIAAALYRLGEDGSIDTSFGTNGVALLSSKGDSLIHDMVVLADDNLVVTGYSTTDEQKNITTAKFSKDGEIDGTFGNQGFTVNNLGHDSVAYSIAEKTDGTFLIAGEVLNDNDSDIVLVHLDRNGFLKSNTILVTVEDIRKAKASPSTVDIAPLQGLDDKILAELSEDDLIATQSGGEPLITDINNDEDFGRAVIVQPDGKVFAAGHTYNGKDFDFALIGYGDDTESTESLSSEEMPDPYLMVTISVTNVTRNSAMSGGVITENSDYNCGSTTNEECVPTVTTRGVVYGVTPYPVYREGYEKPVYEDEDCDPLTSVFPCAASDNSYNYELVRSGQTSDGTGEGTYGSDIIEITPNSLYYVRAYSVLSDATVIYGNQVSFKTDDACFIATAAFGSSLEGHVAVLRQFRDRYLKTNGTGRQFVRFYYKWSPPLADIISQSTLLKFIVRLALLPLVAFSYFMVHTSLQVKILYILLAGITFSLAKLFISRRQN